MNIKKKKIGRDYKSWDRFSLHGQDLIVRHPHSGSPLPLHSGGGREERFRKPGTPIFTLKVWGNRGHKCLLG